MNSQTSIFLVIAMINLSASKNLPATMDRCKENDPSTMNCVKEATQKALRLFRSGIPSLGVFSIDPLLVTQMTISQGNSPVSINLHFANETIHGFGDMIIEDVDGSTVLDDYHLMFKVLIPNFQMVGQYVIDGKVMVLPITGRGHSNLTLVNLNTTANIKGKPVMKKGEMYLEVTDFNLDIEPERLIMYFENLFNGDRDLGSHMNNFLNENWQPIFRELKPSIAETFGEILKDISNRIYGRVPYKKIVL